jgi:hypothetical protein
VARPDEERAAAPQATAAPPGRHGVRRALVTAEVALAVILVVGAWLLARTVYNLARADAGFERSGRCGVTAGCHLGLLAGLLRLAAA